MLRLCGYEIMDQLKIRFFRQAAEIRYLKLKRNAFQDWFGDLMTRQHPDDFLRIRLSKGDGGLDGYRISSKTVFQVFAAREFSASDIVGKMNADFQTATETLAAKNLSMEEWVFVHNDPDDLPHEVVTEFAKLQASHVHIAIRRWEFTAIWNVLRELDESTLDEMFGPGPTMSNLERLEFPAIVPVVEFLSTSVPPAVLDIELPSPEKLEYNQLSVEKAELFQLGRTRQGLVEMYLSGMPQDDKPEMIAQAFRNRYGTLRDSGLNADRVFDELWIFTGGEHFAAEPDKIPAVMAVLSYFFDRCDIFENAPELE